MMQLMQARQEAVDAVNCLNDSRLLRLMQVRLGLNGGLLPR